MSAERIRVTQTGWRPRREVFDGTGQLLGAFDRGEILDLNGCHIVRVSPGNDGWSVFDYDVNRVGVLRSTSATTGATLRGQRVKACDPLDWRGWATLGDSDDKVARIEHGRLVSYPAGVIIADVNIGDARWGSVSMRAEWRMRFAADLAPDSLLRLLSFGWFAAAWEMQHALDIIDRD